jgi:hypothetical protein
MQQMIAEWLAKLGLGQYAQRFAENDITFVILPDLSDQDLEKIGVASLGHRRLLLRAIADVNRIETSLPAVPTEATAAPLVLASGSAPIPTTVDSLTVSAAVEGAGERRYLAVMFCDLVGSTSITAQLDAEEWRDLIGAYLDAASAAVMEIESLSEGDVTRVKTLAEARKASAGAPSPLARLDCSPSADLAQRNHR